MCDISVFGCEDLAHYLVREGRETEAARAFEQWMDATPDLVEAANQSG
jgi:hypothetical protein